MRGLRGLGIQGLANPIFSAGCPGGVVLPEINEVCPAITPTFGDELVTNGSMETGDPPTGWNATNATLSAAADERTGGSGTKSLNVANSSTNYGYATQTLTIAAGVWISFSGWLKKITSNARITFAGKVTINETAGNWKNEIHTLRVATANPTITCTNVVTTDTLASRYDDITTKQITFSSMHTYIGTISHANGTYQCTPTVAVATQAGLLIRYTDANNYLLMLYDRQQAKAELLQCDGGTLSVLVNGSKAYPGNGKVLKVIIDGSTAKLLYDGVQIGGDATITATGLGMEVHGFVSSASCSVGTVTTSTAVT